MKVTNVRLALTGADKELAYGSITLDDVFAVNGIRVVKGLEDKPFVSFPRRQTATGEYKDVAFPVTKELRAAIVKEVMTKYVELVEASNKDTDLPFE